MIRRHEMSRPLVALVLTGMVLASSTAHGAAEARHSGTIARLSGNGRTITLEELGPWTAGGHARDELSIALEPSTKIELVARSKEAAADQWPGGFKETPLAPSDLRAGDYVTVAAHRNHGRLVALSVTVIRPHERE
jgi:hypothetical protein